jgi:hypothetical protein
MQSANFAGVSHLATASSGINEKSKGKVAKLKIVHRRGVYCPEFVTSSIVVRSKEREHPISECSKTVPARRLVAIRPRRRSMLGNRSAAYRR